MKITCTNTEFIRLKLKYQCIYRQLCSDVVIFPLVLKGATGSSYTEMLLSQCRGGRKILAMIFPQFRTRSSHPDRISVKLEYLALGLRQQTPYLASVVLTVLF